MFNCLFFVSDGQIKPEKADNAVTSVVKKLFPSQPKQIFVTSQHSIETRDQQQQPLDTIQGHLQCAKAVTSQRKNVESEIRTVRV